MVRESREIRSNLFRGTARRDIKTWTFLGLACTSQLFLCVLLCYLLPSHAIVLFWLHG